MMKLSEVLKELETYSCFSVQINYGAFSSIIRGTCTKEFRGLASSTLDSSTLTLQKGNYSLMFPNVEEFTFDKETNQYVGNYCDVKIRIYDIK